METTFCPRCGTSLGTGASFCPRCGTSVPVGPTDAVTTLPINPPNSSRDAMMETLRQATLGEYEILAVLGRGGMATVYLAHDLPLDRKVAIKVLAPALLLMGEGMVERFKREARTAAALSHPHIIPIYAVKESNQILYFVMKYVEGRALDAVIHDIGPLPIKMVQTILAQVGDALAYAHRHHVVHRDIKSANIMLDEEGWAVVTDFGIAKVQEAQGLTMTGVTVGTPAYMSPEQCATCEVTGATDQYSLGVVAYEMLTGHLPFQSNSSMTVMYAHFNEKPQAITAIRPDCPSNLADAVMRMLEKEPEDRWPTMDDVVAVCGRPSLRHDDPIRSQMMTLAKEGNPARLLPEMNVPTSPIAFAKPGGRTPAPAPRRLSRLWWGLAAAAIVGLLWWTTPWRLLRPPLGSPGDTVIAPPPQAVPVAAETVAAPRAAARRPGPVPSRRADSVTRAAAGRQEDSVRSSLRTAALAAMRRAVGAGATPEELARGDTVLRGADSLSATGRLSDAMVLLVTATSLWTEAERVAGARTARESARVVANPPPAPPPAPAVPAAPAAPAAPPVDPRVAIESVIAAYARALESRDTAQVRRAYPGLTATQQRGWGDLFRAVRTMKANVTVTSLNLMGSSAEATVSGLYEYENATTGRLERRPASFRATLVSEPTGWRLSTIH
jgi:serine/threonine protein kinase